MRRVLVALALTLAACGDRTPEPSSTAGADAEGPLVVYSGRKDVLVGPLVERFEAATGLDVEVRYGTDAELLATMAEEGDATPADLFWANTAGALGAATAQGLLDPMPDSLLGRPAEFVPSGGRWVPVTTRFRVLAYHPQRIDAASLPTSVFELPAQTAWRGRIGWTPTYSSFQDFVTALRLLHGADSTRAWLDGMRALAPKAYPSNGPMIEALEAGEIDVALTNHYYVLRALHGGEEGEAETAAETAPDAPRVAIHTFAPGDAGNLALVTGAGLVRGSRHREAALRFLSYLLSADAQAFAASEVQEYPVVSGTPTPSFLMPFSRAIALSPRLDFERLAELDSTLALLRDRDLL